MATQGQGEENPVAMRRTCMAVGNSETAPGGTRTHALRFRKPPLKSRNSLLRHDLQQHTQGLGQLEDKNFPDLDKLRAIWPHLSQAVRAGLLAVAEASVQKPEP